MPDFSLMPSWLAAASIAFSSIVWGFTKVWSTVKQGAKDPDDTAKYVRDLHEFMVPQLADLLQRTIEVQTKQAQLAERTLFIQEKTSEAVSSLAYHVHKGKPNGATQ